MGFTILIFALFLGTSVVWGMILHFGAQRMTEDDLQRGMVVLEFIDTLLVFVALVWAGRTPLPAVSLQTRTMAWGLALPVLLMLLGLNVLYSEFLRDILKQNGLQQPPPELTAVTILLVCVQPAVVEELFFRYVAFGPLYRATGLHTTVWVTAVMFAAAHIYNPLGMPYLFLVGIALGYARAWGGLALPMVMHYLHNLAVLVIEGT